MIDGVVITATRRSVHVFLPGTSATVSARMRSGGEAIVGDYVEVEEVSGDFMVAAVKPRKNCLSRSYQKRTKLLAANIDRLLLVTAVVPLFNTVFIDRALSAAAQEGIPVTLVVNKKDLGVDETSSLIEVYRAIGIETILTSTKTPEGLDPLRTLIMDSSLSSIALCGISGVGKSSILNSLIPKAASRVGEVSDRTGQGKQTTSQSFAHTFTRGGLSDLFVIDLPGLQHFGVAHLSMSDLGGTFPEIASRRSACQFLDCSHTTEPLCAVQSAVAKGEIAQSRITSYHTMLEEIRNEPRY